MHACNGISSQPKQRMSVSKATSITFNSFLILLRQTQADSSVPCLRVAPAKCFRGRMTSGLVGRFAGTSCGLQWFGFLFVLWFFFNLSCNAVSSWVIFCKSHSLSVGNVICLPSPGCVLLNNVGGEIPWYAASVLHDNSPRANISSCF